MRAEVLKNAEQALLWTNCRLLLTIPSVLAAGEAFSLRITAFGPDSMPVEAFRPRIAFEESRGIVGLPASVELSPRDNGCLRIDGLKAGNPGHAYVAARPEGCPQRVFSNPARVFEEPPWRIYWGDLHIHTTYSDCNAWACKDPEFGYAYARDFTHLDFAAAADHIRGIRAEKGRWGRLKGLVREFDVPGRFVPFLAFESSHASGFGGDNNAYYQGAEGECFWLDHPSMRGTSPAVPLERLWEFLDRVGEPYMTVPHHSGRRSKYRSFADAVYDPKREPVFEIYSCWGSSERRHNPFPLLSGNSDEPAYFTDALRAGCRYGLIASGDDHRTMPGGERQGVGRPAGLKGLAGYIHHGLAAIRAPELTREAIWDALWKRNCYATTLERVQVDFSVGDVGMGEEAEVGPGSPLRSERRICAQVLTTMPGQVTLVRNGEDLYTQRCDFGDSELVFADPEPLEDIAIREAMFHPRPFVAYYMRVEVGFGQTVWSSPLWLDVA